MSEQSTGGGGARFRRHPDVAFRVIDGEVVVVVPATQAMHTLNHVGSFVWRHCDGRMADEIVAAIVAEFDVTDVQARADLERFVADLSAKRMLVIE